MEGKMLNLTSYEKQVLKALYKSADGNGHDFGFIEDARGIVPKASLGGVVASLDKKGIIYVHEPVTTDSGTWTQFTWGAFSGSDDVGQAMLAEVRKTLEVDNG
jgi:hypothetical protein